MRSNRTATHWATGILTCWLLFILFALLLALTGCTQYNPALFVGYDVLNPSAEVRKNPISITEDGQHFIVNAAFIQWVDELKAEIIKLRKKGN